MRVRLDQRIRFEVLLLTLLCPIACLSPASNAREVGILSVPSSTVTTTVNVRRDTASGLPTASAHLAGISTIVWGNAAPGASLTITLTRATMPIAVRMVNVASSGDFAISVDYPIEDGDTISVWDGTILQVITVPTMTFRADPVTQRITGTAPSNITTTVLGAPHSLAIAIGGSTHAVTTTSAGEFVADFSADRFQPGALGTLRYTTPTGARVYKPLFVVEPFARGQRGDWWADVILGQPDFTQTAFNFSFR